MWEEFSWGLSVSSFHLLSPCPITFVRLTAGILHFSVLLPDTTPEKHGRMMEWIHWSSSSFPEQSILCIPTSLWTLDMFPHFLKRMKTKAEFGLAWLHAYGHSGSTSCCGVESAPPRTNPFVFHAFHFSSDCLRFRRKGFRNRIW